MEQPKWTPETHREYMRERMRQKRAEDPEYGRPRVTRTTIAYCRECKTEKSWRDSEKKEDGMFYCKECGKPLYTLVEQKKKKKQGKNTKLENRQPRTKTDSFKRISGKKPRLNDDSFEGPEWRTFTRT